MDHVDKLLCVQNRLATIVTHLPNRTRPKHNPAPKPEVASKEQAIANSEHCLSVSNNTVQCSACLSRCNLNSACFWEFIKSKCDPANKPSSFNIIALNGQVRMGSIVSHETHKLFSYPGIVYCGGCGFMAGAVMRALKTTCKGVQGRTIHGQRVLDALAAGILPPYVSKWPE